MVKQNTTNSNNTNSNNTKQLYSTNNRLFDERSDLKVYVSSNVYSVLDEEKEISNNLERLSEEEVKQSIPDNIIGWELVNGAFHAIITCDWGENHGWVQVKPRKKSSSKNTPKIIIYGQEEYIGLCFEQNKPDETEKYEPDEEYEPDESDYEEDYYEGYYGLPDFEDNYPEYEYDSHGELCRNH